MKMILKYFVVKPRSKIKSDLAARASREALRAYASVIKEGSPDFADELLEWAFEEEDRERFL